MIWQIILGLLASKLLLDEPPARRFLVVGDSITAAKGGYPAILSAQVGAPVAAAGYVGRGAEHLADRIDDLMAEHQPSDVVVLIGVNDLASGRSQERITTALNRIYARARTGGAQRVYGVLVLPWAGYGPRFDRRRWEHINAWIIWQAAFGTLTGYVDTRRMAAADGISLPASFTYDGLHLTPKGHQALATLITQTVGG